MLPNSVSNTIERDRRQSDRRSLIRWRLNSGGDVLGRDSRAVHVDAVDLPESGGRGGDLGVDLVEVNDS